MAMAMAMAVMISTTTTTTTTTTSLPSSITSSLYLPPSTTTTTTHLRFLSTSSLKEEKFLKTRRKTLITHISSQNPPLEIQKQEQTSSSSSPSPSASEIVRNFYNGINKRDLASVEDLIAEKCVYEDLIFPQPFVGRQAILEFFKKFTGSISKDLQFVIDDISNEDSLAIGVTWHLDWQGRPFPFSKGCSFYRLELINGKKQIIYARDSVEPAIKPGETALVAIRGVTWLLQRFPGIADKF